MAKNPTEMQFFAVSFRMQNKKRGKHDCSYVQIGQIACKLCESRSLLVDVVMRHIVQTDRVLVHVDIKITRHRMIGSVYVLKSNVLHKMNPPSPRVDKTKRRQNIYSDYVQTKKRPLEYLRCLRVDKAKRRQNIYSAYVQTKQRDARIFTLFTSRQSKETLEYLLSLRVDKAIRLQNICQVYMWAEQRGIIIFSQSTCMQSSCTL